jgi:hypothetical protein
VGGACANTPADLSDGLEERVEICPMKNDDAIEMMLEGRPYLEFVETQHLQKLLSPG